MQAINLIVEYWQFIAVFFAGVLASAAGISYFYFYIIWKRKKRGRPAFHHCSSGYGTQPDPGYNSNVPLLQDIRKELTAIRNELEEKKQEIQELRNEISASRSSARVVEFDTVNSLVSRYFTVPLKNGTFAQEKGVQEESDNSWYRIEYKKDKNQGRLFYLAGKADKRALNQVDLFLKPVCDLENAGLPNPQKIQMVQPGRVVLKNGHWSIEEKIKLRLS